MKIIRLLALISLLSAAEAASALGADTAVMNITIRRLDNNDTTNQVFWNPDAITLGGTTKWRRADAYIVINSTIEGSGGIQIYTNNVSTSGAVLPAGLVANDQQSALPLCWRIWGDLLSEPDLLIQRSADMAHLQNNGWSVFMWIADKNEQNFSNGSAYITVKNANGLHVDDNPADFYAWWGAATYSYLYIGADFSAAATPRTYKTTDLTLEAFIQ
jgi:hypothetical protein